MKETMRKLLDKLSSNHHKYSVEQGRTMHPPSKLLLASELTRAIYEYGLGLLSITPLKYIVTHGDLHPVVIFPGLGAADTSTQFLRSFLNDIGYKSYTWGQGRNLGPKGPIDTFLKLIIDHVEDIYIANGNRKISLIGWSLGGVYAREVAKLRPDLIQQVITLGTPFKKINNATNAAYVYELLSGDKNHNTDDMEIRISAPPQLPFTSIYSKTDGVVWWESSIEDDSEISQNIEVPYASHLGLGHNPISLFIIANRLSQDVECWKKYK
jgi:triacylglycerol esterase/lipase EstA (alpha/beta hydrolase family)